jgi:hypothetical protein
MKNHCTPKTPHQLMRGFLFAVTVLLLASCGIGNKAEDWGNQRFGVSYNPETFDMVSKSDNELKLGIKGLGNDFEALVTAFASKSTKNEKVDAELFYESAKNEFCDGFGTILNEVSDKTELEGVTTYTYIVTVARDDKNSNWSGMLKLMVMDDALLQLVIKGKAEEVSQHMTSVRELFDSAYLKGEK